MNKTVLVFKAKLNFKKEKLRNKVFGKRHTKLETKFESDCSFDECSDVGNDFSGIQQPLIEIDFDQTD